MKKNHIEHEKENRFEDRFNILDINWSSRLKEGEKIVRIKKGTSASISREGLMNDNIQCLKEKGCKQCIPIKFNKLCPFSFLLFRSFLN